MCRVCSLGEELLCTAKLCCESDLGTLKTSSAGLVSGSGCLVVTGGGASTPGLSGVGLINDPAAGGVVLLLQGVELAAELGMAGGGAEAAGVAAAAGGGLVKGALVFRLDSHSSRNDEPEDLAAAGKAGGGLADVGGGEKPARGGKPPELLPKPNWSHGELPGRVVPSCGREG